MSFANIIETSLFPIPAEDRMVNATIETTNDWFIGEIADYLSDTPLDRDETINQMALIARTAHHQAYEIGEDAHGKYILVNSKEEFFRPMWERFKQEMENTISLDKFMSYRGEDDKFSDYIYADGEMMTFAQFIRSCVINEPYYLGGIVSYHN